MVLSPDETVDVPFEASSRDPRHEFAFRRLATAIPRVVVLLPAMLGAAVAVTIALASWQGFDFTDEGLSLLSARRSESSYRSFSGVHVFIAPVFDLVGHRVALLRLVKLAAVLAAGGFLGWTLERWSRARCDPVQTRPVRLRGWWSPWPLAVAVGSLMVYSWTALSPSYNDVSVLMTTLAAALTLLVLAEPSRRRWPFALGAVHFCHIVTKWPAGILVGPLVWLVLVGILRERRVVAQVVTWAAGGFLAAIVLTQLLLADLRRLVPDMLDANRVVGSSANQPGTLRSIYLDDLHRLGDQLAGRLWWVLPVALVIGLAERMAHRATRPWLWRWGAAVLAALAVIGFAVISARADILRGGAGNVEGLRQVLPSCLVLAVAVPVIAAIGRPTRDEGRAAGRRHPLDLVLVTVLLVLLPLAQAVGTGNSFTRVAMLASAPWVAVLVLCVVAGERHPVSARILGSGAVLVALVSVSVAAHSGQYDYPYRLATPRAGQTTLVDGVAPLRGIRVDPRQAQFFGELRELYDRGDPLPGQRLFSMWSVPGLTFVLDAVQPGDGWLAASSPERVADSITVACATDPRLRSGELPFVLVSEPAVPAIVEDALGRCGAPFPDCYEVVGSVQMPPGPHAGVPITLWVPTPARC